MLSEQNRALVARLEQHLGISPQTADYLIDHWGQANLLLDAARAEGGAGGDKGASGAESAMQGTAALHPDTPRLGGDEP